MGRVLRGVILFACLAASTAPAAAMEPVLMFLMSVARELIESQAARAAAPAAPSFELPRVYPGTMVEPEHLRALIDESFTYLSHDQRREVFEALNAALLEPKNAPMRAAMIDYFADRARAVRAAQERLAQLSQREKQQLAAEFRKELASLPAEEQTRVGELLRRGLLPVPGDLNQLLLAAFEER